MKFKEWWKRYSRNDFRRSDEIARDAWAEAVKTHQLLIDAARKAVRCRRNGQWKNLEDAMLLMEVALMECDEAKASNAELRGAEPVGGTSRFERRVSRTANPSTIKQLIALCRQQHEALKCLSGKGSAPILTQQMRIATLAAYEQFNQGETK